MSKMKDSLGDAPPTIGVARQLGAKGLLVVCPPPCKHRARVPIPASLPDETLISALGSRFRCDGCERRMAAISIDWGFSSARPIDPRS